MLTLTLTFTFTFTHLPRPPLSCKRSGATSPASAAQPRLLAILLSASLTGCMLGPNSVAVTSPAPADWSSWHSGSPELVDARLTGQASEIDPTTTWWSLFGDPTLERLQTRALQASPDLQSAALHFAQSRVQRSIAGAAQVPEIHATGGITRQRQSEHGISARSASSAAPAGRDALLDALSEPFSLYQAGFDASWELDLWGRVRRSIEAADANVAANLALLDAAQLSVTSEVARNYFELRTLQQQIQLTHRDIQAAEESLTLLQFRAKGGLINNLDVTRQQTLLADLRARLPQLLAQETASINRIGILLGAMPGELTTELHSTPSPVLQSALPDLALGLPGDTIRQRPDIRAAEAQLHAATAETGIATADLYPSIRLGASAGFESIKSGTFGDWGSRRWSIGPSLDLPLFDRGRRRAVVTLRKLEQQKAAIAYQQAVLKAWSEVDDSLSAYVAEHQRHRQLQEKLRSSTASYELASARYRAGLTDFLVELDSLRTLLQAQRDLADSDGQLRTRLVAIYKAIGGGIAPDIEAPTPRPPQE